ncbi:hypothetical protein [Oceanobacter mangrovi]|uniref:hypothetical protein n=1 Tax=Oceanobacter mangrovi TaxID=2862510 RepID=UPI001C8D2C9F|nr:hypothetical protein [Oceanobacter mangrovi]
MKQWLKPGYWLGLLLCCAPVWADPVAWDEPGQHWLSRESEHFAIHYPQRLESQALEALAIAEQVHTDLLPFFGSAPQRPTQMVLQDDVDYSNGWATPVPFAQIRLFASPPDSVNGLESYDSWLHLLIRHEYTHILQMELARGAPGALRRVFGRQWFTFPHMFEPSFMLEGLAVYQETNQQLGYGRLQGSWYQMQMAAEVAAGVDSFNQVVAPLRDWPTGKAYLYGAWFIQFLSEQYGEEKLQRFLYVHEGQLLPYFLLNRSFRVTWGKSANQLWQEFTLWLQQRFPLTPNHEAAMASSLWSGHERLRPLTAMADQLYFIESNGDDRQALWQLDSQNGKAKRLLESSGMSSLDASADGRLALVRKLVTADLRYHGDLYTYSGDDGLERLTTDMRIRQARWLPDNRNLLARRIDGGISELWRIGLDGSQQLVWRGEYGNVLGDFDISPNGRQLVASIKRPQQGWNLELFDLASRQWQPLTQTLAVENDPQWLPPSAAYPNGRILYSADYNHHFDIYALEPSKATVATEAERLTNSSWGAFTPLWLNGGLVAQFYSADGFALAHWSEKKPEQGQAQARRQPLPQQNYNYPAAPAVESTRISAAENYTSWPTLMPTAWLPQLASDEYSTLAGVSIWGSDALGRHYYVLTPQFDVENNVVAASLLYQYDNRWLLYGDSHWSWQDGVNGSTSDPLGIREDTVELRRDYLWRAFDDHLSMSLGVVYDRDSIERDGGWQVSGNRDFTRFAGGAALIWDNRELLQDTPGTGYGSRADLVVEHQGLAGSDYVGNLIQGQWRHTFDLPGRHALRLGLWGAHSGVGSVPVSLGGQRDESTLVFGRDDYALPGFDNNRQVGDRLLLNRLEWSFWTGRVERNWSLWPIGLGDHAVNIYAATGSAWQHESDPQWLTSIGAEWQVELVLGYRLLLPLRLGLAHGMNDGGNSEIYLQTGINY